MYSCRRWFQWWKTGRSFWSHPRHWQPRSQARGSSYEGDSSLHKSHQGIRHRCRCTWHRYTGSLDCILSFNAMQQIRMKAGTAEQRKYVPVHDIIKHLQMEAHTLAMLPGFYVLTGSDTTSYLAGHTEKTCWVCLCSILTYYEVLVWVLPLVTASYKMQNIFSAKYMVQIMLITSTKYGQACS